MKQVRKFQFAVITCLFLGAWQLLCARANHDGLTVVTQVTIAADGLVGLSGSTMLKDATQPPSEIVPAENNASHDRVHIITVNEDGTFTPERVEIFSGDTVEWQFASRLDTIIPVALDANDQPDCLNLLPYDPDDLNEFTGPMPRAVSGIFTISPERAPYTSMDETWQSSNLTGVFIRPRWDEVHLGPDDFNWTDVDAEIVKAVRNRKVFSIGFKAGSRGTPRWIFNPEVTDSPVTPLDFGFVQNGLPAPQGSPADPNFRKHYFDMLRAFAAHLRQQNAFYRALAYIKISGLNLHTHENRLPKDTLDDLATWAGPGRYTRLELLNFYAEQAELLVEEFPEKDMSYALIQDGFPNINNAGEYEGQPTPPLEPILQGTNQTEVIMEQGRLLYGLRFAVQHNGLQTTPDFCPASGQHPIQLSPNFHYVGSGCPNRWVLAESALGQVSGYQTVNSLVDMAGLESALENEWDNSDGIFLEIYENVGLQADALGLPSGMTLADWADRFHERRREIFPTLPDPFPLTHRHSFTRTRTSGGPQEFFFVNGSTCASGDPVPYGTIVVLPDLRFTSIERDANGSVQLTLSVPRAGTLQLEDSENLSDWRLLDTFNTSGETVEDRTISPTTSSTRFFRATLE